MHLPQRRRLRQSRILFFFSGVLLCCVYTLTLKASLSDPWASPQTAEDPGKEEYSRVLNVDTPVLDFSNITEENTDLPDSATAPLVITVNRTDLEQCIYVEPEPPKPPPTDPPPTTTRKPADAPHRNGEYPNDLFSVEQRRQGWVVLHILGMIYMFVSLAIVCDEFFVPTLEVITNKLEISDDVAGATFMAAGGSAPELFTSLIGVFISHSNVGIGTIVGSAVFNILFVIGMCAVFSREMLHLTWWPLFRDVSFYILDLFMLIIFFLDNTILWWESMMLVSGYVAYVSFMKFNVQIENAVKTQLYKHVSVVKVITVGEPEKESEPLPPPPPPPPVEPPASPPESEQSNTKPNNLPCESQSDTTKLKVRPTLQRGGSSASLHNTSMRSTIFQLMIHTLDPLAEGTILRGDRKAPASNRVRRDGNLKADLKSDQTNSVSVQVTHPLEPTTSKPPKTEDKSEKKTDQPDNPKDKDTAGDCGSNGSGGSKKDNSDDDSNDEEDDDEEENEEEEREEEEEEEEIEEPLTLKWPDTRRKQATYLLLLPIVLPLWLTVPDVRNPASKRYFVGTFIGSIIWIAVFSYLMVWWAHQVGETIGISEEIMGLTILAAGTSIPDLITSVIVARKGLGDMAVSSSVGSNIFDITMGLPVPWLMFSLYHGGEPITVSSNGLFCAIVLLFIMLLFVIFSIAACRWKMSRMLGFTMFVLYFVFLVLSVLLEDRVLICPVSI